MSMRKMHDEYRLNTMIIPNGVYFPLVVVKS
jgi:hypothetical protein